MMDLISFRNPVSYLPCVQRLVSVSKLFAFYKKEGKSFFKKNPVSYVLPGVTCKSFVCFTCLSLCGKFYSGAVNVTPLTKC
jgi:hypothetical protein